MTSTAECAVFPNNSMSDSTSDAPGMEFATEMIIKASLRGEKFAEVPITLHRDGRVSHPPHLRTLRDGWRTLRFYLIYSPKWLFFVPGLVLALVGLLGYGLTVPGLTFGGVRFDVHTLLVASLALLLGYQTALFALFAKTFAISERLVPPIPAGPSLRSGELGTRLDRRRHCIDLRYEE